MSFRFSSGSQIFQQHLCENPPAGRNGAESIKEEVANESRSLMEISSVIQNIASETNLKFRKAPLKCWKEASRLPTKQRI